MDNDLFEKIRTLLIRRGALRLQDITDILEVSRKSALKVLESNPYTFDFKIDLMTKKWFISE